MRGPEPAAVRWREDVGWELRCEGCTKKQNGQRFWPLTFDFWNPKRGMRNCRACSKSIEARRFRQKYHTTDALQRRHREASARYRASMNGLERSAMDRKRYVARRLRLGLPVELRDQEEAA